MTINGVNFTNIPDKKLGLLLKASLGLTQSNIQEQETVEEYLQSERFYKLLHVIDIDWDGLEVAPNVIINDTSDFINWLKTLPTKGDKGDTGEQGPVGPQGETGPQGATGSDGITPHIDSTTGNWFIGETDTEVHAQGETGQTGADGVTPHIDQTTGNWFIGETDTGVHAQGEAGLTGTNGITPHIDPTTKHWMIGETDTDVVAEGSFDPSDLQNYATKQEIGVLGNKTEGQAAVNYTEAEVNAANAELEGALEAAQPLTQEQAGAYNLAVDGATKEGGDELSEAEANMYNATLEGAISTEDVKTPAVPAVPYASVAEVLTDIKAQLGGITIVKITQSAYDLLVTKDPNTLYVITED